MSEHKISGACTCCDEMCFEVLARWSENERYPGEPKRLGPANPDSVLVTFMLLDGSKCDLTFCGRCAESLNPHQYTDIWRKVIRSWDREMKKSDEGKPATERPDWYRKAFANGILAEMGRVKWKERTYG